jgi:NAD(P)-dependent dehydrogenase (short-subunit alcohol dehydrogenase family)
MTATSSQGLDGKVAIVTGAAGGIGGATARLFLDLGAKVMMTDREGADLNLSERDRSAMLLGDCSDESAVERLVATTVERFGRLDIMVANAGTEGTLGPVDQLRVEDVERVLRVNVIGVWLAIKHAVRAMKASGGGAIVATSSVAGVIGFPGLSPYVASKHAVAGLVKTAAMELAPANIRVNAVAPGPIDNRMMQSLGNQLGGGDAAAFRSLVNSRIAMGRYGTNEEIAQMIAFLSSDAASYCTGGLYAADGGYLAG